MLGAWLHSCIAQYRTIFKEYGRDVFGMQQRFIDARDVDKPDGSVRTSNTTNPLSQARLKSATLLHVF